jgi:hypothetical protein
MGAFAFGALRAVAIEAENQAPTFDVPPTLPGVLPFETVELMARAIDPDADPLAYFADFPELTGFPPDAAFEPYHAEGRYLFTWFVRGADWLGEHVLRIGAFDGRGGEAALDVLISVCRFRVEPSDVATIIASLFDPQPRACGSGDANGDGLPSVADLTRALSNGSGEGVLDSTSCCEDAEQELTRVRTG